MGIQQLADDALALVFSFFTPSVSLVTLSSVCNHWRRVLHWTLQETGADFSWLPVDDLTVSFFTRHFAEQLSKLTLNYNRNLSDSCVASLIIRCGASLRTLELQHVPEVADKTIYSICEHAHQIVHLNLNFCFKISHDAVGYFSQRCPPSLVSCVTMAVNFTNETFARFLERTHRTLQQIDISECRHISQDGTDAIRAADCRALTSLKMCGVPIRPSTLDWIVENCLELATLNLEECAAVPLKFFEHFRPNSASRARNPRVLGAVQRLFLSGTSLDAASLCAMFQPPPISLSTSASSSSSSFSTHSLQPFPLLLLLLHTLPSPALLLMALPRGLTLLLNRSTRLSPQSPRLLSSLQVQLYHFPLRVHLAACSRSGWSR